jgi:hypothetical protein
MNATAQQVDTLLKTHTGYSITLGQTHVQATQATQNNAWNYICFSNYQMAVLEAG